MEQLYSQVESVRTLAEAIAAHQDQGALVVDEEEIFLLARGVNHLAPAEHILDPWRAFPLAEQDTWYIYAFAGDFRHLFRCLPYPLPLCAWNRLRPGQPTMGPMHFYSTWNAIYNTWAHAEGVSQRKKLSPPEG